MVRARCRFVGQLSPAVQLFCLFLSDSVDAYYSGVWPCVIFEIAWKCLQARRCDLSSILVLQETVSKCMEMFKILRNCMLLIAHTWKCMKMHENVFRRCPSLCRRMPHRFLRVPCFPCSFFIFEFSIGSSSFVFFGIFREVFLQVVFHLGFQRCEGVKIL